MTDKFMEAVYLTLTDDLLEEYCVPGVENLYAEGKPCAQYYSQMLEAYGRLLQRLNAGDHDPDGEIMIDSLLAICREVGYAMYRCGSMFSTKDTMI